MINGYNIFITGASSGIGASCAKVFGCAGAKLTLTARRIERLRLLAATLNAELGTQSYTAELDVRDPDQVVSVVQSLPAGFDEIDVLVNNAGLARGVSEIQEGKIEDWDEMIDTNIKGLLYVTRAILPGMIQRGRGHIINIGSIAGRQVYRTGNVYNATKFAVRALSEAMAIDLVHTPIRVSTVDPGLVETEFSIVRRRGDQEGAKAVYEGMTPLAPDDVAQAVLFCATRPAHVNVSEMVVLPADQASAHHVNRQGVALGVLT